MPVPESKRETKIVDTKYTFNTIQDLLNNKDNLENNLTMIKQDAVRFEDMTKEELDAAMLSK